MLGKGMTGRPYVGGQLWMVFLDRVGKNGGGLVGWFGLKVSE